MWVILEALIRVNLVWRRANARFIEMTESCALIGQGGSAFFSTFFIVFVQVRPLRLVERAPMSRAWVKSAQVNYPLELHRKSNQSINQSNQSNLFNHVTPGSSHRLAIEHFQKRKGLRVNTKPFQQFLAHKPVNFPCKLILSFNHVQDYWKFKADKHKVLSLPGPNNYQDYRKKIRRGINAEWNRK